MISFIRFVVFAMVVSYSTKVVSQNQDAYLIVLGTLQDGGSPHLGCEKSCCKETSDHKKVVSLGIIDPSEQKTWLLEATPDISAQLRFLKSFTKSVSGNNPIDGIFLTHAHIGHYSGLMYLGKEVMGANHIPVYVLPRMSKFLNENGPWSQLVSQQNIQLVTMEERKSKTLSKQISITSFRVPHRDEFSETAGFLIQGPTKRVLFIPDIDKWEKWNEDIADWINKVDFALIDGTFFNSAEVGYRDISKIPHPLISESIDRFRNLPESERNKIYFIHLNHTNPLLNKESTEYKEVLKLGFRVALLGMKIEL